MVISSVNNSLSQIQNYVEKKTGNKYCGYAAKYGAIMVAAASAFSVCKVLLNSLPKDLQKISYPSRNPSVVRHLQPTNYQGINYQGVNYAEIIPVYEDPTSKFEDVMVRLKNNFLLNKPRKIPNPITLKITCTLQEAIEKIQNQLTSYSASDITYTLKDKFSNGKNERVRLILNELIDRESVNQLYQEVKRRLVTSDTNDLCGIKQVISYLENSHGFETILILENSPLTTTFKDLLEESSIHHNLVFGYSYQILRGCVTPPIIDQSFEYLKYGLNYGMSLNFANMSTDDIISFFKSVSYVEEIWN
jgi:hypothetical protein